MATEGRPLSQQWLALARDREPHEALGADHQAAHTHDIMAQSSSEQPANSTVTNHQSSLIELQAATPLGRWTPNDRAAAAGDRSELSQIEQELRALNSAQTGRNASSRNTVRQESAHALNSWHHQAPSVSQHSFTFRPGDASTNPDGRSPGMASQSVSKY